MASKESERVDRHRRTNFDRISVLVDKGGRELYRTLALREGISMTEMVRRAVLARAGLKILPWPDALAELEEVQTQEEARRAVRKLQLHEMSGEIKEHILDKLSPEPAQAEYVIYMDNADMCEFDDAARKINDAIESADPDNEMTAHSKPVPVKLKGYEIGILRRMLANIEPLNIDDTTE